MPRKKAKAKATRAAPGKAKAIRSIIIVDRRMKAMTAIAVIFGMVQDGTLASREQATAIVDAEAERIAAAFQMDPAQARANLLSNIGYCTGYCDHELADQIMDLFQTEHPIFGRTHPTPEEALRLGMERGRASRQQGELNAVQMPKMRKSKPSPKR